MTSIVYTDHARRRMSQRGIARDMIRQTLQYGTCYYRQGYQFYVIRNKDLPASMPPQQQDRLRNLTVVVHQAPDCGFAVITAYRSDRAASKIRRKSKKLF